MKRCAPPRSAELTTKPPSLALELTKVQPSTVRVASWEPSQFARVPPEPARAAWSAKRQFLTDISGAELKRAPAEVRTTLSRKWGPARAGSHSIETEQAACTLEHEEDMAPPIAARPPVKVERVTLRIPVFWIEPPLPIARPLTKLQPVNAHGCCQHGGVQVSVVCQVPRGQVGESA